VGDAGYDVVAIDDGTWSESGTYLEYRTGIALEVPQGFHVELFPRSSISKYDLLLCNSIGLVDNGYRGELLFRFKYVPRLRTRFYDVLEPVAPEGSPYNAGYRPSSVTHRQRLTCYEPRPGLFYRKGDKIGQIVLRNTYDFPVVEVEELSVTDRGTGGFGSTGH
jgi:dUTP pyrophosphatase